MSKIDKILTQVSMKHTIKLYTRENGSFVVKTVTTDKYFTVCPYQGGDYDLDEVKVLSVSDLYLMWQELKAGDKACGENSWKYHFYRHEIKSEHDERTGKPIFIDYITPGKVYRRWNKVFFKAVTED